MNSDLRQTLEAFTVFTTVVSTFPLLVLGEKGTEEGELDGFGADHHTSDLHSQTDVLSMESSKLMESLT